MVRFVSPHRVLIPLLAAVAVLPLLVHGCSCGHDQPFHIQSWLEAAQQFRQGTPYPHWAFSPAWQAGEPRFIFYPPLSWMLGALLTLVFPMNAAPVVFTWIALAGAGFSMHHLVRRFASAETALLCASVYMVNPYMLFNAFERGAYAELLAAVWIPLVLHSALQEKTTVSGIAVPLGLVWLTNAPAGVMATYTVAFLAAVRLASLFWWERRNSWYGDASRLFLTVCGGASLGLALVSFYLLPAAYERRYVQVAMAIIPNLRYQDNFLFSKTDYVPHNVITHSVSVLATVLLLLTVMVAIGNVFAMRAPRSNTGISVRKRVSVPLLALTCLIGMLLTPVSAPIWEHVPNLKYLQFPWRLQTILSAVLALSLTPLLAFVAGRKKLCWALSLGVILVLSQLGSRLYRQGCETNDFPAFAAAAFGANHGVLPTDEYTPNDADNDVQRTDNPGYWLVRNDVNLPAPGTIANPNETITNYDGPIPFENTVAARAPHHLSLLLTSPEMLVLNLRDYPSWRISRNGVDVAAHLHRDDGLLAIALPVGPSSIDIHWQRSWDQTLGWLTSNCAVLVLGYLQLRSRKIKAWSR